MRNSLTLPLTLAAALLLGCGNDKRAAAPAAKPAAGPKTELLLRLHFAGSAQLVANTNTAKLGQIAALPASAKLREQVLQKLARELPARLLLGTNAASSEESALLRPLLEDLRQAESLFTLFDTAGRAPAWALMVRLDEARARAWQTNSVLSQTKLAVSRNAPWVFLASEGQPVRWAANQSETSTPPFGIGTNVWLEGEANLAKLAPLLDLPTNVPWPHVQFSLSSKGDTVRTEAHLRFAQSPRLALDAWRVPTNSLRDPLVSFTAARGGADWLGQQPLLKQLDLKPLPNQFFAWSRTDIPYQTLAALPAPGAAKQVEQLGARAPAVLNSNLQQRTLGKLFLVTNRNELIWQGLPLLLPFVRSAPEPGGDFLLAGLMAGLIPQGANTNPPPRELFAQLERTNLVYYDWEITETRLQQWRQISQLLTMLTMSMPGATAPAGGAWLDAVTPKLGNTITEVTAVSPTELRLVRSSHLGLTGVELVLLAHWLDNPAFPSLHSPAPPPMLGAPPVPK